MTNAQREYDEHYPSIWTGPPETKILQVLPDGAWSFRMGKCNPVQTKPAAQFQSWNHSHTAISIGSNVPSKPRGHTVQHQGYRFASGHGQTAACTGQHPARCSGKLEGTLDSTATFWPSHGPVLLPGTDSGLRLLDSIHSHPQPIHTHLLPFPSAMSLFF